MLVQMRLDNYRPRTGMWNIPQQAEAERVCTHLNESQGFLPTSDERSFLLPLFFYNGCKRDRSDGGRSSQRGGQPGAGRVITMTDSCPQSFTHRISYEILLSCFPPRHLLYIMQPGSFCRNYTMVRWKYRKGKLLFSLNKSYRLNFRKF